MKWSSEHLEQGSRGAEEQRSRGAEEQRSRGAEEQRSREQRAESRVTECMAAEKQNLWQQSAEPQSSRVQRSRMHGGREQGAEAYLRDGEVPHTSREAPSHRQLGPVDPQAVGQTPQVVRAEVQTSHLAGRQLSVVSFSFVRCQLSAVSCQLSAVQCPVSVVSCQLSRH